MAITTIPIRELLEIVVNDQRRRVQEIEARIAGEGIKTTSQVVAGTPFLKTIRKVLKEGYDLVILGPDGEPALGERFLGGSSMHLMRKCPCPVWVMKPGRRRRFMRILAAVAPDAFNQGRDALNATIMDLASSLAEREQAELHVVHVLHVPPGYRLRRPSGITRHRRDGWDQMVREHNRKALYNLLDAYKDGVPGHAHLLRGRPAVLIPKLVKKERIDLVVMGTVCRTGVPGFFMGNTAESILQQVECSVLTVKPDGFVTPVASEQHEQLPKTV